MDHDSWLLLSVRRARGKGEEKWRNPTSSFNGTQGGCEKARLAKATGDQNEISNDDSTFSQAIFTDYKLDKLSRDKAMRVVYAEVTRQCKLSHPAVEGEMMNNALQEVSLQMSNTPK